MGLHLATAHMAQDLALHTDDGPHMTCQLRQGLVAKQPTPTVAGAVDGDEVSIVAGHTGKPEAGANRGGADDADGSRASGDEARLQQRNHRFSG